jgi:hypothetical protein
MIWRYFRMKRELLELKESCDLLSKQRDYLANTVRDQAKDKSRLNQKIQALRDDVSIAGQMQIEIQAKLDDLRLSVKGVRKGCFRFLELTEDPVSDQEDHEPPPPADHLDELRDMVGLKRDGSDVRLGDTRKSGRAFLDRR